MIRYLSVCSGIEAATAAWHPLGWTPVAFSEIEPFPSAVLAHHYPDVPNLGDMTKFKEWDIGTIDLLVGGTPCQSFSVKGLRKGLDDPRGNLMLTYLAIAARFRPRWLVWENVPGVLSSNGGKDFGALLGGLAELGYGFAYRILDAQFFGVPQRRRRVFVVGYLGDWRRAAAVLFERHSLSGHPAPRRKTGQGFTAPTSPSLTASGRGVERTSETRGQDPVIDANFGEKMGLDNQHIDAGGGHSLPDLAMCLNAGAMGRQDAESETLIPIIGGGFDVAHALRSEGFDASEDGTGRGTPIVPVSMRESGQGFWMQDDIAGTLRAEGEDRPSRPSHVIGVPAMAFESRFARNGRGAPSDIVPPLKAQSGQSGKGDAAPLVFGASVHTTGHQGDRVVGDGDIFPSLSAQGGNNGGGAGALLQNAMRVRRLMPVECERLQGFADDYTNIPWRTYQEAARKGASYEGLLLERGMTLRGPSIEECPDGPRYKALGNSMARTVMLWLGRRIAEVDAIPVEQVAA